jgi:hypothetical protein
MTKFKSILKHFPLKKRDSRKIKKIIIKTERNEKKINAKQDDIKKVVQN